ncbi:MAG: DUF4386 domain-containing protein [Anaerolineaceae bacterium]|nr:DUF4386 domain-containing protein [Anaerolineaceae bacterium]
MKNDRKSGLIAGTLYITGTVAGIFSLVFTDGIRSAQDELVYLAGNSNSIIYGAMFILLMGLSLAMIPVIVYPVLKKYHQTFALGYIVFRSGLEAVIYLGMVISWLLLIPLSQAYMQSGMPQDANYQALSTLLLESSALSTVLSIVFILGASMFYYVLFRSKLVPRWLSIWGLLAAIPSLTAGLLHMSGLLDSLSTTAILMEMPLAIQEMVLAIWLIVKGFSPSNVLGIADKN